MSVFTVRTKTRHAWNLGVLVLVCAVVAGGVLVSRELYAPLTAAIRDVMVPTPSEPVATPVETTFPQPRRIAWEGIIFGTLTGGEGLAVRRSQTGELFQAYYTGGHTASVSEGLVRITGMWTGISCAYQRTVFDGRCTPTVDIDVLEILPIALE